MTSNIRQRGAIQHVVVCYPNPGCAPILAHGQPTYFATIDGFWWYIADGGVRPGHLLVVQVNEDVEPGTPIAPTAFTYHFISSNGRVEEVR